MSSRPWLTGSVVENYIALVELENVYLFQNIDSNNFQKLIIIVTGLT